MQLRNTIRRAVESQYGKFCPYSRVIDKYNRIPLLRAFADTHAGIPAFGTREEMWDFLARGADDTIDYFEFGVHEGRSILHWADNNGSKDSRFFGFDSFRGLPEHWNSAYPKGRFDTNGCAPVTRDPRVQFMHGLFQDTLRPFLATYAKRSQLVLHIDCDLYGSSLYCLTQMDQYMEPGTILIFDEFGDPQHEFRAFQDYLSAYRRNFKVLCSHDGFFTAAVQITGSATPDRSARM